MSDKPRKCSCGCFTFELGTWGGDPCLYCVNCSMPHEPTSEELKYMKVEEPKVIKNNCKKVEKSESKQIEQLMFEVNLLKKTVIAFSDSHQGGKEGHKAWCKAIKLYQKCEDEIDLDDNS